jgi:hypothetical protein
MAEAFNLERFVDAQAPVGSEMDDRLGRANPLPPLVVRWAILIVATIMACLFVYWTVRAVRSEEIRVPIRGSTLLFRRR